MLVTIDIDLVGIQKLRKRLSRIEFSMLSKNIPSWVIQPSEGASGEIILGMYVPLRSPKLMFNTGQRDCYHEFRKFAQHHWNLMQSYYQSATSEHLRGNHRHASFLAGKVTFCYVYMLFFSLFHQI